MKRTISRRNASLAIIVGVCLAFVFGLKVNIHFFNKNSALNIEKIDLYPNPILLEGKDVPRWKYTSMMYDYESVSNLYSKYLKREQTEEPQTTNEVCESRQSACNGCKKCVIDQTSNKHPMNGKRVDATKNNDKMEASYGYKNQVYSPSGEHLMVDIKNVDTSFLDSSERLAEALVNIVKETKSTLLSYHCHKRSPEGVSCVGILVESHVSVHTWPSFGVMAIDIFTCGPGNLISILPVVEKLFAKTNTISKENMAWTHKHRGFRTPRKISASLGKDVEPDDIVATQSSSIDFETGAQIKTESQSARALHSIETTKENGVSCADCHGVVATQRATLYYFWQSLFLSDTDLKTTSDAGEDTFYEAFIQPGMFAHLDPKRVLIIGGGETDILREVLKHKTVQYVTIIEKNQSVSTYSEDRIVLWKMCADLVGSTYWCGDANRTTFIYEDPIEWLNKVSDTKVTKKCDAFDIIIVDFLTLKIDLLQSTNTTSMHSVYNALTEDGIVISKLRERPYQAEGSNKPPNLVNRNKWTSLLFRTLEDVGFESLHVYEDRNELMNSVWEFLVVMRDSESRKLWYRSQAQLDVEIHKRIRRTHTDLPALRYFDSCNMKTYMYPHRHFEDEYCRQNPTPESCELIEYGSLEKQHDIQVSDLEVLKSGAGNRSGRGLYTTVDIKKGDSIGRKSTARPVLIYPLTTHLLEKWATKSKSIRKAYDYVEGYGWQTDVYGEDTYLVDSSIMTYANHGCNGTFNIDPLEFEENPDKIITENSAKPSDILDFNDRDLYDPVLDRNGLEVAAMPMLAVRDIKAGEELLTNYVFYTSSDDEWYSNVLRLRRMCEGKVIGLVTQAEYAARRRFSREQSSL